MTAVTYGSFYKLVRVTWDRAYYKRILERITAEEKLAVQALAISEKSIEALEGAALEAVKPAWFDAQPQTGPALGAAFEALVRDLAKKLVAELREALPSDGAAVDAIPPRDIITRYPNPREGQITRKVILEHKPTGRLFEGEGNSVDEAIAVAKLAMGRAVAS